MDDRQDLIGQLFALATDIAEQAHQAAADGQAATAGPAALAAAAAALQGLAGALQALAGAILVALAIDSAEAPDDRH